MGGAQIPVLHGGEPLCLIPKLPVGPFCLAHKPIPAPTPPKIPAQGPGRGRRTVSLCTGPKLVYYFLLRGTSQSLGPAPRAGQSARRGRAAIGRRGCQSSAHPSRMLRVQPRMPQEGSWAGEAAPQKHGRGCTGGALGIPRACCPCKHVPAFGPRRAPVLLFAFLPSGCTTHREGSM